MAKNVYFIDFKDGITERHEYTIYEDLEDAISEEIVKRMMVEVLRDGLCGIRFDNHDAIVISEQSYIERKES